MRIWQFIVLFLIITNVGVYGKEIVAKYDEWTLIGENDTVDAGMHIKIDMTTGEKWVKQIDHNDNNNNNDDNSKHGKDDKWNDKNRLTAASSLSSSASSAIQTVTVTSDDPSNNPNKRTQTVDEQLELEMNGDPNPNPNPNRVVLPRIIYKNQNDPLYNEETTISSAAASTQQQQQKGEQKYDYDMMYRTLSKLPMDEQIRMQLPQVYIPAIYDEKNMTQDSITNEQEHYQQRKEFELQLQSIWEQRQQELQQLDIADIPQVIQEYINELKQYHIAITTLRDSDSTSDNQNTTIEQGQHIISILQELEYQLQDIDTTRDFHTLHGWTTLIQLLHSMTNNTTSPTAVASATKQQQQQQQQYEIQMYIGWVIGTAVKHIHEFTMYAIEPITVTYHHHHHKNATSTSTTTTTAIDEVAHQLLQSYQEYNNITNNETTTKQQQREETKTMTNNLQILLQKKLLRFIYSFGSLLRNNYHSQHYLLIPRIGNVAQQRSYNSIQQIIHQLIVPSLQQIVHYEQQQLEDMVSEQQKDHALFLNKVVQRLLNIILDCLSDVKTSIKDTNDIYNLRNSNEYQQQQIQQIYEQWQNIICSTPHNNTITTTTTTADHRMISQLQSFVSSTSSLSLPASTTNDVVDNIRSTLHSIFTHCPNDNNNGSESLPM